MYMGKVIMFPSVPKRKRLYCILLGIFLVYLLYINIKNVNKNNIHPRKNDHSRFNAKEYTYPLTFDIREVVEKHLNNNIPLPRQQVNPHPYIYYYSPSPCNFTHSRQPYTLVLVKSFVGSIDQRVVIRKMARKATRSSVKLVFMLGLGDNYKDRITQENETYGDLIQENFVDAYSNNTFKTIMGFNWATQYCSEARLLVFLDDDYFVRWDKLVQFLYQSGKNHTDLFIGNLVRRAQPYRNVGSSWFVDPKVYPFRSYPPYLAGGAYVISYDVSKKIKMAFPYVRYIGVDDVYLGIVAQILSISPRHSTELSRRDHLSITKECSHTPSELLAARCQTVAYVSTGRVAKGFEYTIKNLTDVFTNMMMLIQKSLLFFQQIFTSGKH